MREASLLALPLELQQCLLRTVADKQPTALLALACTCKRLNNELQVCNPCHKPIVVSSPQSQALKLVTGERHAG